LNIEDFYRFMNFQILEREQTHTCPNGFVSIFDTSNFVIVSDTMFLIQQRHL